MSLPAFTVWVTGPEQGSLDALADELLRHLAARDVTVEPIDLRLPALAASTDPAGAAVVAAVLLHRHDVSSIVALPASSAARARARTELGRLIEVDVRAHEEASAPGHETAERAEVEVLLSELTPAAGAERVIRALELLGLLASPSEGAAYSEDEEREVIKRLKAFGYL